MGRYPRDARCAVTKCIGCNAPIVRTVDGRFVCVDCGSEPIQSRSEAADESTAGLEIPQ